MVRCGGAGFLLYLSNLCRHDKGYEGLDIVTFISYMPLFAQLHDNVTSNPLAGQRNIANAAVAIMGALKAAKAFKRLLARSRSRRGSK